MNIKKIFFSISLFAVISVSAQDFVLFDGSHPITYAIAALDFKSAPVVQSALEMWKEDMQQVTGFVPKQASEKKANIRIVISDTIGKKEAFHIFIRNNQLYVIGSDARGTAYGILELSRLAGVSPWVWWADVKPLHTTSLQIPTDFQTFQSPAVEFRGIFLNDEDWGLNPWSTKTFEPGAKTKYPIENRFKGQVGPKTYEKIFQLLLRLRANTIWPAMHEVTMPFYFVEGNQQMAERYGIIVSASHCEPMMRNSATEWDLVGKGDYNFLTNREEVVNYWTERLKELGRSENIFTIGMRGKHDGKMLGVKTTEEYKNALADVIAVQTELLKKYINPDVAKIPQQFIPYKEVLDVYNAGLEIPDYVTLVWPDDNHGYIRHFPNEKEQVRSGGNGVYYHLSYWGVPHDNIWLGIVQPSLMYQQMKLAYEKNIRKIWILNVGDIKPSEYLTELFMDLAWNGSGIDSPSQHLQNWLDREFGKEAGKELFPAMQDFYLLSHIRKPEFISTMQVKNRDGITDLSFSKREIADRLLRFKDIADKIKSIEKTIPNNRKDAYFEMIEYSVLASNEINKKWLLAQFAGNATDIPPWWKNSDELWKLSDAAFDSIVALTYTYNSLSIGKWKDMMDYQPRRLPVFQRVKHEQDSISLLEKPEMQYKLNGMNFASVSGNYTFTEGLGYEGQAIYLCKNTSVEYRLPLSSYSTIEIRLVPTHSVEGKTLRFSVVVADSEPQVFDYETAEFSDEWKANVLRSQAIRTIILPADTKHFSPVKITALDEGVVIDQIVLGCPYFEGEQLY